MYFVKTTITALLLTATLSNSAQAGADRLANTAWQVMSYHKGSGMFSSVNTSQMHVNFYDDNRINGFSGCNNFMGTYTVPTSQKIKVSPLGQTRMACKTEDLAQEETAFINTWKKVATYKLRGTKLTLADKAGHPLIQLQVAE